MKGVKAFVIVALIVSLVANVFLYMRTSGMRVQLRVGDKAITRAELTRFLEMRYGHESLAALAKYELVKQATAKFKCQPDDKEIDQLVSDMREQRPALAALFKNAPVKEDDYRKEIAYELGLLNLRTKDVPATDAEIKEYFDSNPGRWDKPDKAYLKVMQTRDRLTADKAKGLMERVNDMTVVQQNVDQTGTSAQLAGVDGTLVVLKPNPLYAAVSKMSPGAVRVIPAGNAFLVVRLDRLEPSQKAVFDEVKPRVARDLKLTQALPAREVMRKLWDEANIQTEDPDMKRQLEWWIFRNSAGATKTE